MVWAGHIITATFLAIPAVKACGPTCTGNASSMPQNCVDVKYRIETSLQSSIPCCEHGLDNHSNMVHLVALVIFMDSVDYALLSLFRTLLSLTMYMKV